MSSLNESLFVSDEVHKRMVKLPDGNEHEMYFREVPATEFRKFQRAEQSDDEEQHVGSMAKLIVASLCEPDGRPALTLKKALTLKAGATKAIFEQVLIVNGYGDQVKND